MQKTIKHRLLQGLRWFRRGLRLSHFSLSRAWPTTGQGLGKSLLLIYDLSSQPFSVGDILTLQEAALVQCEEYGLHTVDVALVYEPGSPVVSEPAFKYVVPENFLFHLSTILPAAQVNPLLRSLFLFGSHREFEKFIADNADRYIVWPGIGLYASREYLFYHCMNSVFQQHFQRYGKLPQLRSRPAATAWAQCFLKQHVPDGVTPISVQLRNNPTTPARNSDYASWRDFFINCETSHRVKFIVICGPSEIDPVFRELSNVVVAKEYYTSLEQDLALIESCAIHMGASSGPGIIAIFNSKPYCMFGYDGSENRLKCLLTEGHRLHFSFSTSHQYLIRQTETLAILQQEFDSLWKQL